MACNNTNSPYCNCQATLLCFHSSTSSSKQWQQLMEQLIARYNVVAPDLYGYGDNPSWINGQNLELADEVARIEPIITSVPRPFHLIGHSYGGAVALQTAITFPEQVASLIVYEPILFGLLIGKYFLDEGIEEVLEIEGCMRERIAAGDNIEAARKFIDYWSGTGIWENFPDWKQKAIAGRIHKVMADFEATLYNHNYVTALEKIKVPVMILYGEHSPKSTRQIAGKLHELLPQSEIHEISDLGHLGPMTHPECVNKLIDRFLSQQPAKEITCLQP